MNTLPPIARHALATSCLVTVAALCASAAQAQQETARVLSTTPIIQQVGVTRDVCQDETTTQPGQKSGAGAVMGGVAGGAIGNSVGSGSGRAAATVLGVVGGAILGDRIEGPGQPQTQTVRHCGPQTYYENKTVAYNVVYEFGGKQYTVQTPSDPGPTIQLQITPILPPPPQPYFPPRYERPSRYYR